MQVQADRLADRLTRHGLEANYFFHGEEPLQLTECGDTLRRFALEQGVAERRVFTIENASDWAEVSAEANALSLFAERRLLEIRLGTKKPDKAGVAAIEAILERGGDSDVFLFTAAKHDARTRRARWFSVLENNAVCIQARDIPRMQLPRWLERRAAQLGRRLDSEAAELIAERVEGNLLAAAQEVEKLCLVVDGDSIGVADALDAVGDQSRFDVYQCADALLAGDLARGLRITRGLRGEGLEPVLLAWALGRELRQLVSMAASVRGGKSVNAVVSEYRVWDSRKRLVAGALERHNEGALIAMLQHAMRIDTMIKGARRGAPWDEIEILARRLAAPRR